MLYLSHKVDPRTTTQMKNTKKVLVKFSIVLGALALMFSLASTASAALTLGALTVTSDGALTLSGAAASAITLGDAAQTGTISIGASTGAMTLNLGTGNSAKTINVGTGNAIDNINIGTGGTGVDVITIGDSVASVAITDAQWSVTTAGAATLVSAAIGGGTTLTKVTVGNLADGASGWVPDAAETSFTITADAASVGANSLISVSLGANASSTACGVSNRTAATNFVVSCSAAPANGATLQYMIVN